jgi:glycosyltransferase involved in cell wall biosynthesis
VSRLTILSLGGTRGLWEGDHAEDVVRMKGYAEHLDEYIAVTNSYKKHRLRPIRLAPNFEAIPTDAFTPFDSFLRILIIGRRIFLRCRVSLIQAQDPFVFGLAAVVLGRLFRCPVNVCVYGPNVYDEHWTGSSWLNRLLAPLGRWVLRASQGIQVDGAMTARSLIARGFPADRVALKPMVPANVDQFLAIPRTPTSNTPMRLLFVGRLCSQKNLPLLLEVVKRLRGQTRTPFELRLVGDGPTGAGLEAIVEREGLRNCVTFTGPIAREMIAREFAEADVFVLTSDYEGNPRVLMEATAAALPVVTTAVSGSDESVFDGESGFIVPIRSAQRLVEKLAWLIERPEQRLTMGLEGRRRIRERLDPSSNTPAQLAIWNQIAPVATDGSAPRHLLLFNLVTDLRDPVLGFTTQWIRELAARVETIDVITMRAGEIDVPANVRVYSAGRELGYSEPRRVFEFYRHLFRILSTRKIDGCFSHMIVEFSALAGPVLRVAGVPLVTWYAHPSLTLPVKLAHFFSNRMVTSLPTAYPHRRDKLSIIGQGIDPLLFTPVVEASPADDLVLCVGRVSRVKDHPTLLRAVALLSAPIRIVILGATAGPEDERYASELRALVVELGLGDRVTFAPPVPPTELPAHYSHCAVHVNLTPAGFGDKVAWEAMSCARPCLVANADFRETLGVHAEALSFQPGDAGDLAGKLGAVLAKSAVDRSAIGAYLRAQVERLHSLPRLAERILAEIGRAGPRTKAPAKPPLPTGQPAPVR